MDAGHKASHGIVMHIGSHCAINIAQVYSLGVTSLAKVGILVGFLLSFALKEGVLVVGVIFGRHDDIVAQTSRSGLLYGWREGRNTQVESKEEENGRNVHFRGNVWWKCEERGARNRIKVIR